MVLTAKPTNDKPHLKTRIMPLSYKKRNVSLRIVTKNLNS